MRAEYFASEISYTSLCAYFEPTFSQEEIRYIPCMQKIAGSHVKFTTLLETEEYFDLIELEVHGY